MEEKKQKTITLKLDENGMIVLGSGQKIVVKGRGGWLDRLEGTPEGADISHENPAIDGRLKFRNFRTKDDPYGAGKIFQEPSLKIPFKEVGLEGDGYIVGAMTTDEAKEIDGRFSISNIVFFQKKEFAISSEGELFIDGVGQGFLAVVFLPDKNCLDGYVGIFVPEKPETVVLREMEDLVVKSFI
jgi:hypothetical protein